MLVDYPVIRRRYIVTAILKNHDYYKLVSLENQSTINITICFYSIEEPTIGDVLELPDSMFYYDDEHMLPNHMLCFEKPNRNVAFPDQFNIQEDYAYITYSKTCKRVMIQRAYG